MFRFSLLALGAVAVLFAGCASPNWVYHYVPGRTATLQNGYAIAPPQAPADVQIAIAAANRIAGLPYAYGAGHAVEFDGAYDCSGAASFVLRAAGLLDASTTAHSLRRYGSRGPGEWITIYARRDHVFLVLAGLRFDTGWTGGGRGPRWTMRTRPTDGCVIRHPARY